jgi:hypothetical protein
VLEEEAAEEGLGDVEVVDGEVELLVAAFHEDDAASAVRMDGVEAAAEAVEQGSRVAEDLHVLRYGGVVVEKAFIIRFVVAVVEEREDAGLVALVGGAEARRPQGVVREALIGVGGAQRVEAVFEGVGGLPKGVGGAVAVDEERAKLGVGDDGALLVGVVGAWLLFDGRRRLVLAA